MYVTYRKNMEASRDPFQKHLKLKTYWLLMWGSRNRVLQLALALSLFVIKKKKKQKYNKIKNSKNAVLILPHSNVYLICVHFVTSYILSTHTHILAVHASSRCCYVMYYTVRCIMLTRIHY